MATKGAGSLYHPTYPPPGKTYAHAKADGTLRASPTWWCKYYVAGRPVRESTGTDKDSEARRFLNERVGRVATGQPILPRTDRVLYDEAARDLREHYRATGRRNLEEAEHRLAHLDRFFTNRRLTAVGPALATQYILLRQAEPAANGTINRELGVLGRMLRLAYRNGKLLRLPVLDKLQEARPRAGFFERAQFEAVWRRLRPDLRVAVGLAYSFGWRVRDEVLTLERRQVDLAAGTIRLDPGSTKNDDGRVVYLTPELAEALTMQMERVKALERTLGRIIPWVFPHLGKQNRGQRIKEFRRAWQTACRRAGLAGKIVHDFRRTAARNLVNAGVPERVAMQITGHRTRSVFDRYHIVSPGDLQEASRRLAAHHDGQRTGKGRPKAGVTPGVSR